MKKPLSYTTFILLSSSIILSACGGGNSVSKISLSTSALMSEVRPLSNEERIIATRICYGYQSKSKNFRGADFLGGKFHFSTKYVDCSNQTSLNQVTAIMEYSTDSVLVYNPVGAISASLPFFKKVQTDTTGYLSQLCSKIKENELISNTLEQENVRVQISFIREGLDGLTLQYFIKQIDGSYKIDSVEKFKVRTLIDYNNGQVLGMDEFYSTEKRCDETGSKNKASLYEQSFIGR
ncbi:MAG: hypothetical protein KBD76_10340 [Bacteriovorax sp.]|nr:hypothetical protein [Bacteriovorax sp.]